MSREELESKLPAPADASATTPHDPLPPLPVIGSAAPAGDDGESEEDVEARLAHESLMRHRRARRRKRLMAAGVLGGIVVAALVAFAVATGQGAQQTDVPQLQTMPVMRGEFSESVQATGTAQPLSSVVVTPEVDGIIDAVNVAEGSVVSEGDVLLTIRNDDLDRAVREAEISVRGQRATVSTAQDAYNRLYKQYRAGVTEPGGVAVTKAEVQAALAELDGAKLQLESAQQTYDEAVATAAKRTVTAPSSGSVVVMNAVPGAALGAGGGDGGAGGALVQIADLSQMTVKVQVNEVDISRVAVGQAARVTFSALPGAMLDAQVTRISTVASADEYGYNYGVVTYDVELLIPEPAAELKPGMTASVEIMLQHVPDALTVPSSSLMTDDGVSYYVYVMTDPETQAIERRDVTVGEQSGTTAVVSGGVTEGDLVVLDPFSVDPSTVSGASGGAGVVAEPGGVTDGGAMTEDGVMVDDGAVVDDGAAASADATAADTVDAGPVAQP